MNNKHQLYFFGLFCVCTAFMLWACSGAAHGFEVMTTSGGSPIRWPTLNAGFYINTAGGPTGASSAIQSALQTWTNVTTSNFSFIYRGPTTSTAYGQDDGTNMICFGSLSPGEESTLALNTFWSDSQGTLLDSDIKFNTAFVWATNGSATAYDVQTTAVHELGHALALDDLYGDGDAAAVMYGYSEAGEIKRSLAQDDKDGITYLYNSGISTTTTTANIQSTTTTTITPTRNCPARYALGEDNPRLEKLRAFRDGILSRSAVGRRIIELYDNNTDSINAALERSPVLRAAAQGFFETAALLTDGKKNK